MAAWCSQPAGNAARSMLDSMQSAKLEPKVDMSAQNFTFHYNHFCSVRSAYTHAKAEARKRGNSSQRQRRAHHKNCAALHAVNLL